MRVDSIGVKFRLLQFTWKYSNRNDFSYNNCDFLEMVLEFFAFEMIGNLICSKYRGINTNEGIWLAFLFMWNSKSIYYRYFISLNACSMFQCVWLYQAFNWKWTSFNCYFTHNDVSFRFTGKFKQSHLQLHKGNSERIFKCHRRRSIAKFIQYWLIVIDFSSLSFATSQITLLNTFQFLIV